MALPVTNYPFTGSNGDPLGANWTVAVGAFQIFSNQANSLNAGENIARWTADAFGTDHYAQAAIVSSGGAWGGGVGVRLSGTNGYVIRILNGAPPTDVDLNRVDTGTSTLLTTITGLTIVDGDVFKLTAVGSLLTVYQNGVSRGSFTDATYGTGSAGISTFGANGALIDDFSADDIGGAVAAPRTRFRRVG